MLSSHTISPLTLGAANELPVNTIVPPDSYSTSRQTPGVPEAARDFGPASMLNGFLPHERRKFTEKTCHRVDPDRTGCPSRLALQIFQIFAGGYRAAAFGDPAAGIAPLDGLVEAVGSGELLEPAALG